MTTTAALTGTSTTDTSGSKAVASGKSLAQNFDTFLTMLTTQLKHQDPLSPMDSTQFTNQLVQFAGVEQQINANSNLEKLIGATNLNTKSQAISYIGHTIEADTPAVPLQDGKASFSATLADDAVSASVVIKNAKGDIVANLPLKVTTDRQEMTWDGKNSDGQQLEDGLYTASINARDANGDEVEGAVTVYGKVTDVASDSTGTLVGMGKVVVSIDKVLTVRDTASVQSSTGSNTTTN
ncbi:MAG TPA: flagellar hook capping FlgD N-terminal domain-containing protein [Magnetospirillum sp.]|nr:flagellar hook capping FlgD N-terminal domain-containing protein [Magnetospirillum sp.]